LFRGWGGRIAAGHNPDAVPLLADGLIDPRVVRLALLEKRRQGSADELRDR
jgi:hypothetical protein